MMLGIECIQAYRVLARKLRRGEGNYRDPGPVSAILKRYRTRGELTEQQEIDFLSACHIR